MDSRESTNPRFRNPRFLFGVFFLYLRQKNRPKPQNKNPPLKKGGLVDSRVDHYISHMRHISIYSVPRDRYSNPRVVFQSISARREGRQVDAMHRHEHLAARGALPPPTPTLPSCPCCKRIVNTLVVTLISTVLWVNLKH